jgi:hypothetical protein
VQEALVNSVRLLRPPGYLLLVEPVFRPPLTMDVVFYVKSMVCKITDRRIPILGYWNNIGAPIVSYYNPEQLTKMIQQIGNCEILETHLDKKKVDPVLRCLGITYRAEASLIIRVNGSPQ